MRFLTFLTASTALIPGFVTAHSGVPGAPKIFGRWNPNELKSRSLFESRYGPVQARSVHGRGSKAIRQAGGDVNGQCGAAYGTCSEGFCCSSAGYCGQGKDYCAAPDCQITYGPGCDGNAVPPGTDTSSVSRPQLGSVAYGGEGIYHCTVPGTVALTYDDGPYVYTAQMLDVLASYGAKATFFITANNLGKGEIDNAAYPWAAVIQRMHSEGHQVASHTFSHQDLSLITQTERLAQMTKNEMALRNILGFFPTYMRPPYSSCTAASGCQNDLGDLGYHISYFDLDTDDYNNVTPELIQNAKNNFAEGVIGSEPTSEEWLSIAHDIHEQTALNLTAYMLDTLSAQGFRAVTMGECLGDAEENWYRSSSGSVFTSSSVAPSSTLAVASSTSTAAVVTATAVSADGSCGGTSGSTCLGFSLGNCCSQYGYCGSTDAYCGDGCQSSYGLCGNAAIIRGFGEE